VITGHQGKKKSLAQRRRHGFFNPVDSASPSIGHHPTSLKDVLSFYYFYFLFFTWLNLVLIFHGGWERTYIPTRHIELPPPICIRVIELNQWKPICEAFQSSLRVHRLRLSFNLINFHLWPFEFLFFNQKEKEKGGTRMSRRLKNMYTYNARSRVFRTILPGLGHIQQLPIRLLNNLASLCLYTHTHSLSLSLSISILLSFFGGFCYDISKLLFGIFHHIYSSGKDGVVGGLVCGILCCMPVDGRSSFRH
jgi:hypothetical protein